MRRGSLRFSKNLRNKYLLHSTFPFCITECNSMRTERALKVQFVCMTSSPLSCYLDHGMLAKTADT